MPARDKNLALPGSEGTPLPNTSLTTGKTARTTSIQKQAYLNGTNQKGLVVPIDGIGQDMPTAMIAPEDYIHIYKKDGGSAKMGTAQMFDLDTRKSLTKTAKENLEPMPTAFIAPEDYQHVFHQPENGSPVMPSKSSEKKNNPPARQGSERKKSRQSIDRHTIKRQDSEKKQEDIGKAMPTALITPEDYQHVYRKPKTDRRPPPTQGACQTTDRKVASPDAICQPMPTAFIAPEDYQHIFHKPKADDASPSAQVVRQSSGNKSSSANRLQQQQQRTNEVEDSKSQSRATFKPKNKPGVGLLVREQEVEEELGQCLHRKGTEKDNRKSKRNGRKPSIKINDRQVDMHTGYMVPMSLVMAIEQFLKTPAKDATPRENRHRKSTHKKDKRSKQKKR